MNKVNLRQTAKIDIGIEEKNRKLIADEVAKLLADSYTLYLRTHNFHWNVRGPMFQTLHIMFEQQYIELALAVDLIAERIRTLGFPAPGTYEEFAELSSLKEERGVPSAERMVLVLCEGQEEILRTLRRIIPMAEELRDFATVDLLTQRVQVHEKKAWMLRSILE